MLWYLTNNSSLDYSDNDFCLGCGNPSGSHNSILNQVYGKAREDLRTSFDKASDS